MFDRYCGAFFAAIGLAIVSFGLGAMLVASNESNKERYLPYRYIQEQPARMEPPLAGSPDAQSFQYRIPCREPKSESESDLCAQWRAAKAGEDSARWTKWGVWVGVIGSLFLLWQIILTRKAVEDTREATKAMVSQTEAMHKQNRLAREQFEFANKPILVATFSGPFLNMEATALPPPGEDGAVIITTQIKIANESDRSAVLTGIEIGFISSEEFRPYIRKFEQSWERHCHKRLRPKESLDLVDQTSHYNQTAYLTLAGVICDAVSGELIRANGCPAISALVSYYDDIGVRRRARFTYRATTYWGSDYVEWGGEEYNYEQKLA